MALTKEQFFEKYKNMPEDIKEAYSSVDTAEILQKIAKNNNLTVVDVGVLADETGLLMLGITLPNKFVANLSSRLEIDAKIAQKIAGEINSEIFYKIRDSLKKIHDKNYMEFNKGEMPKEPVPRPAEKAIPQIIKPALVFAPEEKTGFKKQPVERKETPPVETPQEIKKVEPEIKPEPKMAVSPEPKIQPDIKAAIIETLKQPEPAKNILDERTKDELFRLTQEVSEKPHPDEKQAESKKEGPRYPGGSDPYREPAN